MIERNELQRMISDIEFRWVIRVREYETDHQKFKTIVKEEKILQYRVQKGDGFRGWTDWQEVKVDYNETIA